MKTKKITKIITYFLLLIIFLGLIAMLRRITSGETEKFQSFNVTYQDEKLSSESRLVLPSRTKHRFDVSYTYNTWTEEKNKDYFVRIIPKEGIGEKFSFFVAGIEVDYEDVGDITKGFKITKYDGYFILDFTEGITLEKILEKVYDKKIEIPNKPNESFLCTLVISSYDESETYYIDFSFEVKVESLTLNLSEVVF